MKKLILIILVSILTVSCNDALDSKTVSEDSKDVSEVKIEKKEVKTSKGEYANPAFMMGSDFLAFFKALKKVGDIDMLISFTSNETIDKFGKEDLKDFYKNSFTNMSKSKLKGMTSVSDSVYLMHYINSEFATKRTFDLKVVVENDSSKIILDNLENKYPFK